MKATTRKILRPLLQNRERFELWAGLTLFTAGLAVFLLGWTILRGSPWEWSGIGASVLVALGVLGLSGKVPFAAIIINGGLAPYEPKRGGQIAVLYGAALFGLGVFGLSSFTYSMLEPTGSYGLAALLGGALILGGLYIIASTPILEPSQPHFEADEFEAVESDEPWYVLDDDLPSPAEPPPQPFLPRSLSHQYAVPLVRVEAAAKRPSLLDTEDILGYAMIECDWVEMPSNYTCVTVDQKDLTPVIENGDIVGINHAIIDAAWLQGKLVAAYTAEQDVRVGFLDRREERYWLRPRDESHAPIEVDAVQLIGAVEWNLKSADRNLLPADSLDEGRRQYNESSAEDSRFLS